MNIHMRFHSMNICMTCHCNVIDAMTSALVVFVSVARVLQQVKSAFDPLNSHCSSTVRSTNILDLTRSCQQLTEAIKFRLLPGHVAVSIEVDPNESWADSVTRAEHFAHEVSGTANLNDLCEL